MRMFKLWGRASQASQHGPPSYPRMTIVAVLLVLLAAPLIPDETTPWSTKGFGDRSDAICTDYVEI